MELRFRPKPVVHIIARLASALLVELVSAAADPILRRLYRMLYRRLGLGILVFLVPSRCLNCHECYTSLPLSIAKRSAGLQ
jgi:hypothetical protein